MKDLKNIDDLFRETFNNLEVAPPASVKVAVDKSIVSKKRGLWWLPVLALLLATTAVFLFMNPNSAEKERSHDLTVITAPENHSSSKTISHSNNSNTTSPNNPKSTKLSQKGDQVVIKDKTVQNSKVNTNTVIDTKPNKGKRTKNLITPKQKRVIQDIRIQQNDVSLKSTPIGHKNIVTKVIPSISELPIDASPIDMKPTTEEPKDIVTTTNNADTVAKQVPTSVDSSNTASNSASDKKNHKDKTAKLWTASIYLGPQFDAWNAKEDKSDFSLNPSFRTSVEINRSFKNNFSASTGIGYNKFQEKYSHEVFTSIDSVYVGLDSIPIWQNDTIVGYQYIDVFDVDSNYDTRSNTYKTTAITIPIYFRKSFDISNNWVVMADAGFNFNFYKSVRDSGTNPLDPEPTTNSFGINATMRLHAGYKLKDWIFTFGVNGAMYLKTPVNYNVDVSKRYYISPQVGIHYNF